MLGGPGFETEIARCEIELFVVRRIIRDVHLAIFPEQLAVTANDRGGIVVETGGALLEKRSDDDGAALTRDRAKLLRRGTWNFLGQSKVGVVLRLAEILRPEKSRQTNNLRAPLGRF